MLVDVEFKDGTVCRLKHLYIWNKCHYYEADDCYLIVPYQDVRTGREVRYVDEQPKPVWNEIKEGIKWKEIGPTSS